ncbi:MAG: VOC family protein [Oscillospiraceae bacterium]|jgi:lactoylglutathione lyase|nr:VOC family protein [Oscillospiraceae bacterium]
MDFIFKHNNINVLDIDRSVKFYQDALGLTEQNRFATPAFTIVFMGDGKSAHALELTALHDRTEPYDLGDNEIHLAFGTADLAAAKAKHKEMGVVCFENEMMGIYFIEDPDGYWMEIVPA